MATKRDIYAGADRSGNDDGKGSEGGGQSDPSGLPTTRRVWHHAVMMIVLMLIALWIFAYTAHVQDERDSDRIPKGYVHQDVKTTMRERMEERVPVASPVEVTLPRTVQEEVKVSAGELPMDQELMVRAMDKLRTARDFLAEREYGNAESLAIEALELWPDMNGAQRLLGVVYWQRQQFPQAVEMFEAALQGDPFSAEIFNNLAMAYLQMGEVDKAEEYLMTALDLEPDYAVTHLNLGFLHLARARFEVAAEFIEDALETYPNNVNARNNLSVCLVRLGRYDEARRHLQLLVDRAPEVADPYFNLAVVYVLEEDYEVAMEWIKRGAENCTLLELQKYLGDPDLDDMRGYPAFLDFINTVFSDRPLS